MIKKVFKRIGVFLAVMLIIIAFAVVLTKGKTTTVIVAKQTYIDASISDVWEVTALQFDKNAKWDSAVNHSFGEGEGINGSNVSARICKVNVDGINSLKEQMVTYEPRTYTFSYLVESNDLPSFMVEGKNTWKHTTEGNGTIISMKANMKLRGLMGVLMKIPLEKSILQRLEEAQQELKHFIELGKPHPRKIQSINTYDKR